MGPSSQARDMEGGATNPAIAVVPSPPPPPPHPGKGVSPPLPNAPTPSVDP